MSQILGSKAFALFCLGCNWRTSWHNGSKLYLVVFVKRLLGLVIKKSTLLGNTQCNVSILTWHDFCGESSSLQFTSVDITLCKTCKKDAPLSYRFLLQRILTDNSDFSPFVQRMWSQVTLQQSRLWIESSFLIIVIFKNNFCYIKDFYPAPFWSKTN